MLDTNTDFTDDEFATAFDVADELFPSAYDGWMLALDDLDPRFVKTARKVVRALGLSWPPYLPEFEEVALDRQRKAAR